MFLYISAVRGRARIGGTSCPCRFCFNVLKLKLGVFAAGRRVSCNLAIPEEMPSEHEVGTSERNVAPKGKWSPEISMVGVVSDSTVTDTDRAVSKKNRTYAMIKPATTNNTVAGVRRRLVATVISPRGSNAVGDKHSDWLRSLGISE